MLPVPLQDQFWLTVLPFKHRKSTGVAARQANTRNATEYCDLRHIVLVFIVVADDCCLADCCSEVPNQHNLSFKYVLIFPCCSRIFYNNSWKEKVSKYHKKTY